MRRLATVLALMAPAAFAAAPDVEVTPVWNGRYLPNAATEISVRVATAQGADVEVSATTAAATSSTRVTTAPGTPLVVRLPLAAPGHGIVDVRVTVPGADTAHRRLRLRPAEGSLRVCATACEATPGSEPDRIETAAESMPFFAQGYDIVGALVVDGATLARLTTRQLAALEAYLAACGRAGMIDIPAAAQAQLRSIAGCGGRELLILDRTASIAPFLDTQSGAHALPSAASLATLLNPKRPGGAAGLLFGLATLPVLGVALLARAGMPLAGLVAAPLVGTLLAAVAVDTLRAQTVETTYADMVSGDRSARFVRLVRVEGGGPARTTIPVDPGWIEPSGAGHLLIEASGSTFDHPQLLSNTAFLGRQDIVLQGVRPLHHPLRLTMDGILPSVANIGDAPVDGVLLAWRGGEFALPTLQPGQTWSPQQGTRAANASPPRRLLQARSGSRRPALMAPLEPGTGNSAGWVLIRVAGGVTP